MKGFGKESQRKQVNSKVCVIGLGGLRSQISTQLAARGVGYLRIVDFDTGDNTNFHRQHFYSSDKVGELKGGCRTGMLLFFDLPDRIREFIIKG